VGALISATGPAGALPGAAVSGLGGLVSLFATQRPKVIISAYEEQAMAQMREVRGDPLTTSIAFVGSDPRNMAYLLGRLGRRDATPRFP
jgi:hypothetical protein